MRIRTIFALLSIVTLFALQSGCNNDKNAKSTTDRDSVSLLYNEKKYEQVIDYVNRLQMEGKATPSNLSYLGRSYYRIGNFSEAIPHLKNVISQNRTGLESVYDWSIYYLGKAYLNIDNLDSASTYLNMIIVDRTVDSLAKEDLIRYGLSTIFDKWEKVEAQNILFHFHEKTTITDINAYAKDRQNAFDTINLFFNAKLPKKMDYYAWNDVVDFGNGHILNAGFAMRKYPIVHSRTIQSRGHEIAHVISEHAVQNKSTSPFINEGIATYFDLTYRDLTKIAKNARNELSVTVIDMWKSDNTFRSIKESQAYAIAGAFTGYLIEVEGKNKYFQLLSNQTYENAEIIYGNNLATIISNFEAKLKNY